MKIMKEAGYTRQERQLIQLMRFWIFAFSILIVLLITKPEATLHAINYYTSARLGFPLRPTDIPATRLWLIATIALLSNMIYTSYLVQKNIIQNIKYTHVFLLTNLVLALSTTVILFTQQATVIYVLILVTSSSTFLITLASLTQAKRSRTQCL